VSVYACGIAGGLLLAAAALVDLAGGPPVVAVPTATELAALTYLAVAVTAVVFLLWYAAVERLGVARAGLFNGLIPVTSLAAVAVVGTGEVTGTLVLGAVAVLAGLLVGLTGPAERGAQEPPRRERAAASV
jgi:drug/metabolite transporter (DMT)-like permease